MTQQPTDDRIPERDVAPAARGAGVFGLLKRYGWLVGVLILVVLIKQVGFGTMWRTLRQVDLRFVIVLMLMEICSEWTRALKWRYVLGRNSQAIGLFFISKAAGNFSPGRVGELSPLALSRHRTPRVAAWIVVDRLLETTTTLVLGGIGLLAIGNVVPGLLSSVAVASCFLIVVPVLIITRRGLFEWLAGHTHEGGRLYRMAMFFEEITGEVRALTGKLPVASILTVMPKLLDVGVWVGSYWAFGGAAHISYALGAVCMCLIGLVSALPVTPILTGVPHAAAGTVVSGVAGVSAAAVVSATGLQIAVTNTIFWISLALGTYDLRHRRES